MFMDNEALSSDRVVPLPWAVTPLIVPPMSTPVELLVTAPMEFWKLLSSDR